MKSVLPKNERFEFILEEVRTHGDLDLASDRANVRRDLMRRLLTYTGDDFEIVEWQIALDLAQREGKLNQKNYAKQLFLGALERHASITEAVAAQKWYTRSFFETWRSKDPEFDLAWSEAIERAVDKLRIEAWRRGADGYDEPVTHLGQFCYDINPETGETKKVTIRKYSDGLLKTMLNRYDPAFRERVGVDLTASVDGGVTQDAVMKALGQLTPEELGALANVLDIAEAGGGTDD